MRDSWSQGGGASSYSQSLDSVVVCNRDPVGVCTAPVNLIDRSGSIIPTAVNKFGGRGVWRR